MMPSSAVTSLQALTKGNRKLPGAWVCVRPGSMKPSEPLGRWSWGWAVGVGWQRIALCDCGGCLGKSASSKAAHQEGRTGTLAPEQAVIHR